MQIRPQLGQMASPSPSITPLYEAQINDLQTYLPIITEEEVQDYPYKGSGGL